MEEHMVKEIRKFIISLYEATSEFVDRYGEKIGIRKEFNLIISRKENSTRPLVATIELMWDDTTYLFPKILVFLDVYMKWHFAFKNDDYNGSNLFEYNEHKLIYYNLIKMINKKLEKNLAKMSKKN